MKYLVIGHGRHGKDTVCEILQQLGLTFVSSSWFVAEKVIFPHMNYDTVQECYDDRHNHRQQWHDLIHEYCKDDHSRLVKEILAENDIYCGLRNRKEFEASKHLFDVVFWVDRSEHLPPESSNELTADDADFVIDNNGSLEELVLITHTGANQYR